MREQFRLGELGLIQMHQYRIDQLSIRLTEDITWRLREISAYRRAINSSDQIRADALLRGSVPLLYAHWEGYFNVACSLYLGFVAEIGVTTDKLKPNFWAITQLQRKNADSIKSERDLYNLLCDLRSAPDRVFRRGRHAKITGRSNLNAKTLATGLEFLGLDSSSTDAYSDFLDQKLLPDRNFIAHGESLTIDESKFDDYRNGVIELMRLLKNEIENAASQKEYLKPEEEGH